LRWRLYRGMVTRITYGAVVTLTADIASRVVFVFSVAVRVRNVRISGQQQVQYNPVPVSRHGAHGRKAAHREPVTKKVGNLHDTDATTFVLSKSVKFRCRRFTYHPPIARRVVFRPHKGIGKPTKQLFREICRASFIEVVKVDQAGVWAYHDERPERG
jgi:hypothetical protein